MGEVTVCRLGVLRENHWTRVKLVWRTSQGAHYEVERFEPLPRGAEAFLRDQVTYFARLGFRVMSLQASQAEHFDGRRLIEPNPSKHWQPQGFALAAQFPEGTDDAEALITLVRGPGSMPSEDAGGRERLSLDPSLRPDCAEAPTPAGRVLTTEKPMPKYRPMRSAGEGRLSAVTG